MQRRRSKGRGSTTNGRSKTGGRFFRFDHGLATSAAWLACTPPERAVFMQIASRYDGYNNGMIPYSVREAMEECHVSNATAAAAFHSLVAKGLLDCTREGGFNVKTKKAREWRVNTEKCNKTNEPASRRFRDWSATVSIQHTEAEPPQNIRRYQSEQSSVLNPSLTVRARELSVSVEHTVEGAPSSLTVAIEHTLSRLYHADECGDVMDNRAAQLAGPAAESIDEDEEDPALS